MFKAHLMLFAMNAVPPVGVNGTLTILLSSSSPYGLATATAHAVPRWATLQINSRPVEGLSVQLTVAGEATAEVVTTPLVRLVIAGAPVLLALRMPQTIRVRRVFVSFERSASTAAGHMHVLGQRLQPSVLDGQRDQRWKCSVPFVPKRMDHWLCPTYGQLVAKLCATRTVD